MNVRFKSSEVVARNDKMIFESWLQNEMQIDTAIRKLAQSNEWKTPLTREEFVELADSLGYKKWNARKEI